MQAVRYNPLRNYQFRIHLRGPQIRRSGPYVAGVQRVSGLSVSIEASEIWEGGNNLHRYANPNRANWDPITLEQGVALDGTLEEWATAVLDFLRTGRAPSQQLKRNLFIDVWDPDLHGHGGSPVGTDVAGGGADYTRFRRYEVFNAWPSKLQAMPQLDAMGNEVALLSLELMHEGWRIVTELPSDLSAAGAGGADQAGTNTV